MSTKTWGTALAAILISGLLGACAPEEVAPPPEPVEIGTVFNMTGARAVLDVPSSKGADLAADRINEGGGVLGRPLWLSHAEGDSDPEAVAEATRTLLADHPGIVALMGLSDTDMLLAAAPVASEEGLVFVTSGATSPQLPSQVPEFLFLACFGDNVQAAAAAEWAFNAREARRAMVLYDNNESYPRLLQGYFIDRFTELGGEIALVQSVDPRVDEIEVPAPGDVDIVFLSVETAEDAVRVIPLLRAHGFNGPILGGDGYDAESIWADHADLANVYFTTHAYMGSDNPNPLVGRFIDDYAARYEGEAPSSFAALGYDTVGLLAAAIENAGNAKAGSIAQGLSAISGYKGVTGTIGFSGGSRIPVKSVTILKVEQGRQLFVAEVLPASVPSP